MFLWSLLAVFRAPTFRLFLLAVGATEYGLVLSLVCLGLFLVPASGVSGDLGHLLALVAAGLFLSSFVRGCLLARREGLPFFGKRIRSRPVLRKMRCEYAKGLQAECFFPAGGKALPLVVAVHGGGWNSGSNLENADFLRDLAGLGFFVASVSYRLAPESIWPAQREDVLTGLRHLLPRSGELGFDPDRIYLLGVSAGGQIASALATAQLAPEVRGCICLYAPFDLVYAYENGKENDILNSLSLLRQLLGGTPESARKNFRDASAYHLVRPDAPPFLLLHGTRDELVWVGQSCRFAARLRENGVACAFVELPWATHAFEYGGIGPGRRIALSAIQRFVFSGN